MTRSIFDPSNGNVERDGSSFTPPDAEGISHLPDIFKNPPSVGGDGNHRLYTAAAGAGD